MVTWLLQKQPVEQSLEGANEGILFLFKVHNIRAMGMSVYYTNLEKKDTLNILYLLYGVHVKPVLAIKISGHFLKEYTAWWDAITTS